MIRLRYYIADCHFFHAAQNERMDRRGFSSVDEMNEYMLEKWNHKVRTNDDVVILGDLSFGRPEETAGLLNRLHGRLYLISGNHDRSLSGSAACAERFGWIRPYEELSDNNRKVILCHYPIMCYNGQYHKMPETYMLYGHVHDTQDQRLLEQFQEITRGVTLTDRQGEKFSIPCNMINCFCKYSGYEPLTLDEWIVLDAARRQAAQNRRPACTAQEGAIPCSGEK